MRADLHLTLLHAAHLGQIDQVPAVAAGKGAACELFLIAFQRAGGGEIAILGIKADLVAVTFHIIDGGGVQAAHAAVHGDGQIMPRPPCQLVDRLLQLLRKGKVRHRFQYIVQRTDLVPFDGILRHVGDEHEQYIVVQLADALGSLHAVQPLHLNIKEDHVKGRAVVLQNLIAIGEACHLKLGAVLAGVAAHIVVQLVAYGGFILDNGNFDHSGSLGFVVR